MLPQPSYPGIRKVDDVIFYKCPSSYCCTNCETYNTCAENREGTLCSHCSEGYTEGLFSNVCVKNSSCNDNWIFILLILAGLLYAVFLLFQADFKRHVFGSPLPISCSNVIVKNKKERPENESQKGIENKRKDEGGGFLILLFYYFQDATLLYTGKCATGVAQVCLTFLCATCVPLVCHTCSYCRVCCRCVTNWCGTTPVS